MSDQPGRSEAEHNTPSQVDLLRQIWSHRAFDPAPSRAALPELHVPYDELTATRSCEGPLRDAIDRGERVALLGGSGAGKSSAASWVLGPLVEGLAPLPIPISPERPEIATEPAAFAGHVVRTIASWVSTSMPGRSPAGPRPSDRSHKFTVGAGWLGANGSLSYELHQVASTEMRTDEVMDRARELLGLIAAHGLRPVLVLDDTDKWISAAWSPQTDQARRQGFFGTVIRVVADELDTAAVVAVHPTYLNDEAYRQAQPFLGTTIQMPRLPDPAAIAAILAKRAALSLAGELDQVPEQIEGLLDEHAAVALYDNYLRSTHGDVRRAVLLVAHTALTRAVDAGHDRITRAAVETAISDFAAE